jgi:hypothetical protein
MRDEGGGALDDDAAEARAAERLGALAEYAAMRNRWLLGADRPGDRNRRGALRAIMERTGGVPDELTWPKSR